MYHLNKLGGTTVGKSFYYPNILKLFTEQRSKNEIPAFVVSAINCHEKQSGTTNNLINLYKNWEKYSTYSWEKIKSEKGPLYNILKDHENLENILNIKRPESDVSYNLLEQYFHNWKQCDNLDSFISTGELLSANLVKNFLSKNMIHAEILDLSNALIKNEYNINSSVSRKKLVKDLGIYFDYNFDQNKIPVITGFLGIGNSCFKTFDRGYSDATSSIVAATLKAKLSVWKESGGVFTGHPFKLKHTNQVENISLNEAKELTAFGNDVLHPSTSHFVEENKIDVSIKDIKNIYNNGTVIHSNKNAGLISTVTAIAVKENISSILIKPKPLVSFSDVISIIQPLSPYIINITKNNIYLAIKFEFTTNLPSELYELAEINVIDGKAIISCIGEGMKNQLGTASLIFSQLSILGVNIEMISQGPDEINISILVDDKNLWSTVQKMHNLLI